jgi:hypothetical protein
MKPYIDEDTFFNFIELDDRFTDLNETKLDKLYDILGLNKDETITNRIFTLHTLLRSLESAPNKLNLFRLETNEWQAISGLKIRRANELVDALWQLFLCIHFDGTEEKRPYVSIEDLDFTMRTYTALKRYGINSEEELLGKTLEELKRVRNLGRKSQAEIFVKFATLLDPKNETYPPISDEKFNEKTIREIVDYMINN